MRRAIFLALVLSVASPALAQTAPSQAERATRWQQQVAILASDAMEGRAAGTPGHMRAVEHIVAELQRLGLEPAGTEGFLQPIRFVEQRFDPAASTATLVAGGNRQALALPAVATVQAGRPIPERVDAPLVFAGFGLHIPDAGHDDLAGLDTMMFPRVAAAAEAAWSFSRTRPPRPSRCIRTMATRSPKARAMTRRRKRGSRAASPRRRACSAGCSKSSASARARA